MSKKKDFKSLFLFLFYFEKGGALRPPLGAEFRKPTKTLHTCYINAYKSQQKTNKNTNKKPKNSFIYCKKYFFNI